MRITSMGCPFLEVQAIPHDFQNYASSGDWEFDEDGCLHIRVSDMPDDYAFLIAIHEAIEAWLCRKRGIPEAAVTAFDVEFEAKRAEGNTDEPGDDAAAPYRKEHFFATSIERLLAAEMGVDWETYEDCINALGSRRDNA